MPFVCKVENIHECQCSSISLSESEQEYISGTYTGCLCLQCLLAMKDEQKNKGD